MTLPTPAGSAEPSAPLAGIGLMLAGICLFALGDAIGKFLVGHYHVAQLLLLRGLTSLALLSPFIWRERVSLAAPMPRPGLQILRIVLATIDVALFFIAAIYLPLADIITYYLAAPIFVTAFSALLLGESVGWRRWSAVAAGFCGVLIALQPSSASLSWPALIALCGSLSFAGLMVVTRLLRGTSDLMLAMTQIAGPVAFGAAITPFVWTMPTTFDLALFLASGLVSVGAMMCVNRSLKLAPATVVVPYQYTMIVWAVVFGYLVFGDVPSLATLLGASLIAAAGFYIFLREQRLGRGASVSAPP